MHVCVCVLCVYCVCVRALEACQVAQLNHGHKPPTKKQKTDRGSALMM